MTPPLRKGWARFFHRSRWDEERAHELQAHLEIETDENIARGMSPEEARDAARRKLGNRTQIREEIYRMNSIGFLETLWQDMRFGIRTLSKSPGFTAVAVLTLALGIGANTAIFSVVNAVLLRPLPFPNSSRLVMLWATSAQTGAMEDVASYPDFVDWKAQSKSFEGLAALTLRTMILTGGDRAEIVEGIRAAPGFFETLEVQPALGRAFRSEEQEEGASHVAILSDSFWKERFAGRSDVLGQTIRVNAGADEQAYTVIGVMPPGFKLSPGGHEQIFLPLVEDPNRSHGFLLVMGRLRPHVSISQAQAEMNIIARRLAEQYPNFDKGVGVNIVPFLDALVGGARIGLLIFLGVVTLVLLIACTNVANLMLARSASRQKEIAVRAALGAGRPRLIQQLLTESATLALAGGALGLLLAIGLAPLLVRLISKNSPIPRLQNTHTDAWVLGFALVLSLLTGLVFGVVPALAAASPDLNDSLRESGRTATGGVTGRRARNILVVTEIALALVLLASAGLLLKSLLVMRSTAPGFRAENLLTVDFWLPQSRFAKTTQRLAFFRDVLGRVQTLPGVSSAALVADLPLGGGEDGLGFHIVGRPDPSPGHSFSAGFNIASPGYFRTMEIPVHAGREFTAADGPGTPGVIVINETAARRFWPGENPIGRQITMPVDSDFANNTPSVLIVVGVTGDVRHMGLGTEPRAEIFLDDMQPTPAWPWLVLIARTTVDPMALAGTIKGIATSVDPHVPVAQMRTMDDVLSASLAQPRIYTLLLGVFATLALALAAIGLYGVVSYSVAQRTHEMGIRMALGAAPGDVLRLVLRQGLLLATIGIAIGLVGALAATRLLTHLIPSVHPGDPLTLAVVSVLLMGIALAASYLPARRATQVDPVVALRHE